MEQFASEINENMHIFLQSSAIKHCHSWNSHYYIIKTQSCLLRFKVSYILVDSLMVRLVDCWWMICIWLEEERKNGKTNTKQRKNNKRKLLVAAAGESRQELLKNHTQTSLNNSFDLFYLIGFNLDSNCKASDEVKPRGCFNGFILSVTWDRDTQSSLNHLWRFKRWKLHIAHTHTHGRLIACNETQNTKSDQ